MHALGVAGLQRVQRRLVLLGRQRDTVLLLVLYLQGHALPHVPLRYSSFLGM